MRLARNYFQPQPGLVSARPQIGECTTPRAAHLRLGMVDHRRHNAASGAVSAAVHPFGDYARISQRHQRLLLIFREDGQS